MAEEEAQLRARLQQEQAQWKLKMENEAANMKAQLEAERRQRQAEMDVLNSLPHLPNPLLRIPRRSEHDKKLKWKQRSANSEREFNTSISA